jgi:7-carboxy-7-deazaguanine synthase
MHIAEIFYSIQGEGPAMGMPAHFIRLAGCNLRCEGCDTHPKSWRELSPGEILDYVESRRVIITGGEPTLQMAELSDLISLLNDSGKEIHLETNGTNTISDIDLKRLRFAVISPKYGTQVDLLFWAAKRNAHLKFVIGQKEWCWPKEALERLIPSLPRERVWLMPFGVDIELKEAKNAWDLALQMGVNYSDRLHIRLGCR